MRIAFITEPWNVVYPKDNGGGSSIPMLTYQFARRLKEMKHEVVIFSKQANQLPAKEVDRYGIVHRRIHLAWDDKLTRAMNILDRLHFHLLRRSKHPLWTSPLYYSGYIKEVCDYLEKWNPDIVHIHDFSQFIPVIRRIVPKARIVIHMHCEWLSQLDAGMIRRRLQEADLIIGCSEYITRRIRQRFPEFSARCQTVYNGADLSQFSLQDDLEFQKNSRVLLFAGRLSPEKGVHVLLDAFKIVRRKFPDARLKIVGSVGSNLPQIMVAISDDQRVLDLARFYNIPPSRPDFYYQQLLTWLPANEMQNVSFLGHVPYTKMQDVYHDAGVFINSSLWEAFTLPVLEAMASGLPVIASEVGGTSEVVSHGETGLIIQPGDPEGLAQAIICLFEDKELRQNLRTRAIQEIDGRFSWETIAEQLVRQYQNMFAPN